MRKEVADLLRTNKQESARIRVEAAMRENLLLQADEVRDRHPALFSPVTKHRAAAHAAARRCGSGTPQHGLF